MSTSSPPPEHVLFRARVERPRGGETGGRNPTQEGSAAASVGNSELHASPATIGSTAKVFWPTEALPAAGNSN